MLVSYIEADRYVVRYNLPPYTKLLDTRNLYRNIVFKMFCRMFFRGQYQLINLFLES